jgi:acyl-CoA dehydrogenase
LRQGKQQLAFALTEPGAGSGAAAIQTRASMQNNDAYVLEGEKTYITCAATADIVLMVAKTSAAKPKAFGIFMVPKGIENVAIEPLSKLASNVHASCRIKLDGIRVAARDILGGAQGLESAWPVGPAQHRHARAPDRRGDGLWAGARRHDVLPASSFAAVIRSGSR